MIKSKEGIVEVEGSKEVVLADFLTLVMGTYKSLKEKMPEEKAAQSLIKYTQKGIKFSAGRGCWKEIEQNSHR